MKRKNITASSLMQLRCNAACKKKTVTVMQVLSVLAFVVVCQAPLSVKADGKEVVFEPTHESLVQYGVPKWYSDGKFGLYLSTGLNTVPAFHGQYASAMYFSPETKPQITDPKDLERYSRVRKHHEATYGPLNEFGFKDFAPMFTCDKFDADYYADLAVETGAKYFLMLGVHHGGFAIYDSKYFPFNTAKLGPKRDLVEEIFTAMRKRAIPVGISTHIGRHWRYYTFRPEFDTWDPKYEALYGHRRKYDDPPRPEDSEKWELEHRDIIQRYKPDYIFIDGGIMDASRYTDAYIKALYRVTAYYYTQSREWGKGVVLSWKRGAMKADEAISDRESLVHINQDYPGIVPYKWQVHTPLVGWFYTKGCEDRIITPETYLRLLVDVVSRNGNLLLGIAAKSDGALTENQIVVLDGIGKWMKVNGEGIYGTSPWKTHGSGSFQRKWMPKGTKVEPDAVRFTTTNGAIYAFLSSWPETGKATIKGLTNEAVGKTIKSVSMLGSHESLKWKVMDQGLEIAIPKEQPCDYIWTVKIQCN